MVSHARHRIEVDVGDPASIDWCRARSSAHRLVAMPYWIQRAIGTIGFAICVPLLLILGLAVRLSTRGPAFHRAIRVRPGGTFTLIKLRTMGTDAAAIGGGITAAGDPRVTPLGRFLRRTKIDELPQLWNVVLGDMVLVGPRPEDPRYVDLSDPLHARVFGQTPGITGAASVAYRDEEGILASAAAKLARGDGRDTPTLGDIDRAYREVVLPAKLRIESQYIDVRTWRTDVAILKATLLGRGAIQR